ncbi:MAG: VOC family protein [Solirubrobacteraceae bacterium]
MSAAVVVGPVSLTVSDLPTVAAFYERAIGLQPLERREDSAMLGSPDGTVLVALHGAPDAAPAPLGSTGLFHLALLVPDRPELARQIERVQAAGVRFTGASDHLVSEALYLNDPEGNGIEIYRDRPREEWGHTDGQVQMATLPLDSAAVMAERPLGPLPARVHEDTRIGHVHLHVQDLAAAERFYAGELGLDVMVRTYPGALFLSRGGYHHHIGLNTWSRATGPPPSGSRGLRSFVLDGGGHLRTDPAGNGIDSGR